MSYATMDTVQTFEEMYDRCLASISLVRQYEENYTHEAVGFYFLLENAEQRQNLLKKLNPTHAVHARILQLIRTFESAEIPDPPVKKKRGRPRKNQGQ